ncbi:MAG: DRTGG domain-containing protein [Thermoleophilia bacterium]
MSAKRRGPLGPLYVIAAGEHDGKSAIALGMCLALRKRGYDAGYFKPVGVMARHEGKVRADADALAASEVLELADDLADVCPVALTAQMTDDALSGKKKTKSYAAAISMALSRVSQKRDVVVMEALGDPGRGAFLGLGAAEVAEITKAHALLVAGFGGTAMLDRILAGRQLLGRRLMAAVINRVPKARLESVETGYHSFLEQRGVDLFGVIRDEPRLSAVSVAEIRERLGAEILSANSGEGKLVSSVLVGAMNQEHALSYFQRVKDKAVITGGDRADIILAALETPTSVVILTGHLHPAPSVIGRAEELGVPLLLTGQDTMSAAAEIHDLFGHMHVREKGRLEVIAKLIEKSMDVDAIVARL